MGFLIASSINFYSNNTFQIKYFQIFIFFFRLTIDELDTLWDGLVNDEVCKDELFNWLLRQVRCREQHTFNVETLTHLYCEKLLSLAPENYTMVALSLFTQLCNMAQQQVSSEFLMLARNGHTAAMEHLSKIALKASNNGLEKFYINNLIFMLIVIIFFQF